MTQEKRGSEADVAIIGGGVIGCGIARELSKYKLSISLFEAASDVAMGASRANSAILHAGYDARPGSLMAKMNVRGNTLFSAWCKELCVPLKRCGSLVIAITEDDIAELEKLYDMGKQNGVPRIALISGEAARSIEPLLNPDVKMALHAPTAGITCPYELTFAAYENASMNGVSFYINSPVEKIEASESGFIITSPNKTIKARYIINAAGLYADEIARMIGDESFSIIPRKGEYMLLDRLYGSQSSGSLKTIIFQTPSKMGKGVLVSPTVDGNAFCGPTASDGTDKADTSTTISGMAELARLSAKSVPTIDLKSVITSFAGIRAVSGSDFIMRPSEVEGRFIHIAGICSPGLSSMPAIAEEAVRLLEESGLALKPNTRYVPYRQPITRFSEADWTERAALIEANPRYGRIVCRCESVSEAEIVEAIHHGARTVDGIKRRTRAGMGRCQGGFCSPFVMEILARETGVPMEDITKFGGKSRMVYGKLKEVGDYDGKFVE